MEDGGESVISGRLAVFEPAASCACFFKAFYVFELTATCSSI